MRDPVVLTRDSLAAQGISEHLLRKAVRDGSVVKIGRGMYLRRTDYDELGPIGQHRVRAMQLGGGLLEGEAISHVSAAILHGLDVWNTPLQRVHVSRPRDRAGRITSELHTHTTDLNDDVVSHQGVPVTSMARTIVDLARTRPHPQAVVAGDSALRIAPGTRTQLPQILASSRSKHGVLSAKTVLAFLDGRSESVGESLSRVRMSDYGLPRPDLQYEVVTLDGRRYRVDFFWEEYGVVGEFDGALKYTERHHLIAEKQREDAIRDLGLEAIRWNWTELDHFEVVAQRFERAADRYLRKQLKPAR
jgi:hypothetical protein